MNLLKSLPIVLTLFSSVQVKAQNSDTTCIKIRYISLKQTQDNASLFSSKDKIDETSMIKTFEKLVKKNSINLYCIENDFFNLRTGNQLKSFEEKSDNSKNDFIIEIEAVTPLANMYGEDSVVTIEGEISYVYPPNVKFNFNSSHISEIRIKEERILNKTTNKYSFQPTALAFCIPTFGTNYEIFWIDLNKTFKIVENIESYEWYQTISKQKYKGFQYMQEPCY